MGVCLHDVSHHGNGPVFLSFLPPQVLKNGRVVEQGSHYELLARPDGVYTEMWNNQMKHDAEDKDGAKDI